ncbi:MAG: CatA-like O-acetyltransferase, partial [Melioribacteraceae bacterium]|nr:CatA-like O-acetyltransferase [Melioribacteraceae bacterium]
TNFDNPFFSICSNINVTELLTYSKRNDKSFFLGALYLSIKTANQIDEFRCRIEDDQVVVYDRIHPFSTVINEEKVFNFCEFEYSDSFSDFSKKSKLSIAETNKLGNLNLKQRNDVIHYTTIPWISLTSITHPRNFNKKESIPKIVFGKYYKDNYRIMLPVSIEVHHGLMDGYHVGKFLETFRENISDCEIILGSS